MKPQTEMIVKPFGQFPDEFETKLVQELRAIALSGDVRKDLKELYITSAKEIEVSPGQKAIIIFVPFSLLKRFHKIQKVLVPELEKKFIDHHVVIIAQRTILGKNFKKNSQFKVRPRSRTLTAVHEAILDDLVYPSEIVGKRTRVHIDGSKELKVYLSTNEQSTIETKLETFAIVYKKLTNKNVVFKFPSANPI